MLHTVCGCRFEYGIDFSNYSYFPLTFPYSFDHFWAQGNVRPGGHCLLLQLFGARKCQNGALFAVFEGVGEDDELARVGYKFGLTKMGENYGENYKKSAKLKK